MNLPETTSARPDSMNNSEVVVSLRGVGRFFDDFHFVRALIDVNLEVRRGEILGLLGPKDSGKSTALRILAGRLRPTEGKVTVFGRSPRRRRVKARIGYLPEPLGHGSSRSSAGLTGFLRQLFGGFSARSFSERRKRAIQRGPETHPAAELLPGAHREITLTQALLNSPDLVLLDEPFFAQEPDDSQETKALILALARRGKTVVLTGDSLLHAPDICSRLAVFYAGRIQAIGTLPELLRHPDAIRFTAPLLPRQTAERALNVIKHDLQCSGLASSPLDDQASSDKERAEDRRPPAHVPSPSQSDIADRVLAPLASPPGAKPVSESQPPLDATVDHERLDQLAKRPVTRYHDL